MSGGDRRNKVCKAVYANATLGLKNLSLFNGLRKRREEVWGGEGGECKSVLQSASGLFLNTVDTTSVKFIKPRWHTHRIMSLCVSVCVFYKVGVVMWFWDHTHFSFISTQKTQGVRFKPLAIWAVRLAEDSCYKQAHFESRTAGCFAPICLYDHMCIWAITGESAYCVCDTLIQNIT